jgi:hypothetical protein
VPGQVCRGMLDGVKLSRENEMFDDTDGSRKRHPLHKTKQLWTHYLRCASEFSLVFLVTGGKLSTKHSRKCSTLSTEDSAGDLLILTTTLSLFWKTLALRNDPSEQILVCFKIAHDVLGVCCPGTEQLMKLKCNLSSALASVENRVSVTQRSYSDDTSQNPGDMLQHRMGELEITIMEMLDFNLTSSTPELSRLRPSSRSSCTAQRRCASSICVQLTSSSARLSPESCRIVSESLCQATFESYQSPQLFSALCAKTFIDILNELFILHEVTPELSGVITT